MSDKFWNAVERQLTELKSAKTADDVLRILSLERNPYGPDQSVSGEGFFAGSGGDGSVMEALNTAGWRVYWARESFHYCMAAPNGSKITYVEGDIFRGDKRNA